ncbi:MAG: IclR family transcriptional regulator [Actinomycetes bacterium]
MPDEGASAAYTIESVNNALRILHMLRERRTVRVTDVSESLGVARSTAHRLLTTLAAQGFVRQERANRAYRAGRVLVEIGLAAVGELDVRRQAHRHLQDLSRGLRETVNLFVLEGAGSRFIDGVEGDRPVRVGTRTGLLLPAHTTSGGKVLLAELPFDEVRALFPDGLPALTSQSITDLDALEAELATVRERGYATNAGESEVGLHAVAVPIRVGRARAVAALAASTPAARMGLPDLPAYVEALQATAEAIGADLA